MSFSPQASLRWRARGKLAGTRFFSWSLCAFFGGGAIAFAAKSEGLEVLWPFVFGAGVAGIASALRFPYRCPTKEIHPEHDSDGLLRAALSISEDHPFSKRILQESSKRSIRFRPVSDLLPLFALFCGMGFLFLWVTSGTPASVPNSNTMSASPKVAASIDSEESAVGDSVAMRKEAEMEELPEPGPALEVEGWTHVSPLEPGFGEGILGGLNYGLHPSVIKRFEQLRPQSNK